MSTPAAVGIRENGVMKVIYTHSDGNPEWNGALLHAHYTTAAKVRRLIALGSISILAEKIEPRKGIPHTYENRQSDVCLAYRRDMGEDLETTRAKKVNGVKDINWGKYAYIFDVEKNYWITYFRTSDGFKSRRVDYSARILELIENGNMTKPKGFK